MDAIPVRSIISDVGTSALARQMGLPITTLHQWKQNDRIPGAPASGMHKFRVEQFLAAVRKLRSQQKKAARAHGRALGAVN